MPGRLGVPGLDALPPSEHAVLLAAHAWSHQPLGRLGNLIDVAVALARCEPWEAAAVARRWGSARLWSATHAAIRDVLLGQQRSAGATLWARHLRGVRERTVFEWHLHDLLAPVWEPPAATGPGGVARAVAADLRPEGGEPVARKLHRARLKGERGPRPLGARPRARRAGGDIDRRGIMSELKLRTVDVHWREIDGEVVGLEARQSTYLAANQSGSLLWRELAAGTTREQLAGELVRAYGIEPDRAAADVERFLDALDGPGPARRVTAPRPILAPAGGGAATPLTALELALGLPLGTGCRRRARRTPTPIPWRRSRPPCCPRCACALPRELLRLLLILRRAGGRRGSSRGGRGCPEPIPATHRALNAPAADERAWQELVVRHLGLPDWHRVEVDGELDAVGPVALRRCVATGCCGRSTCTSRCRCSRRRAAASLLTGVGGRRAVRARR